MTRPVLLLAFMWLALQPVLGETSAERTMRDFARMGIPIYEAHDIRLLPTAEMKFRDLFQAVDQAEKYILLDYFKFQQDSICGELLKKLRQKVREGVEVSIIFDSFGNQNSDQPLSDTLQASLRRDGISIQAFDPVRFPWLGHLLHRDHHKIAVIDGRVVYTGGMNVADYYLHGKPKVGHWRDMHVRMSGDIVLAYEELFWKMWAKGEKGKRSKDEENDSSTFQHSSFSTKKDYSTLQLSNLSTESDSSTFQLYNSTTLPVAFTSRWPKESPAIMRKAYAISIDNAQRLVQIVNPYATLFGEVRAALRRALERGVRVQFMVSTKSDSRTLDNVIGLEMRKLMKRGAEVYYFDDGFHHSKVMMVDSLFCTVGTTNLDARSLSFDYEVNAFIFDAETTHELQDIFSRDARENSTLLTPDTFRNRFPPRRRIRGRFFSIIKRML